MLLSPCIIPISAIMVTLLMSNDKDGCGKRLMSTQWITLSTWLVSNFSTEVSFQWTFTRGTSHQFGEIYPHTPSPDDFFTSFPITLFPSCWPSSYRPWISEQLSIWPFLLSNQIIYSLTCFIQLQRSPKTEYYGNLKEYNNFRKYYNHPRTQCFYPECLWKKIKDIYETFINLFTITYS